MNFLFRHNDSIQIKCTYFQNEKAIQFYYALPSNSNFSQLAILNLYKKHDLVINSIEKNFFTFFLLKSSQCANNNLSIECISLNANLYNLLFQEKGGPIIIIGTSSGHVYWQNFLSSNRILNDFILLETSSQIIYINSFRYNLNEKKLFDALFKSSSISNQSNYNNLTDQDYEENCLFAITSSSRIYLFAYINDYIYKCCILPHHIKKCIKCKTNINEKSYLIYSTQNDNNLYSIDLDLILKEKQIKPNLIRRNFPLKKFIFDNNQNLLAISLNGKQEIIKIDDKPSSLYQNRSEQTNDIHYLVKTQLNKICDITNKIVKEQIKLDKYNLALKQFNHLQQLKFDSTNRFQIEKKFTNSASLEIKLINKNLMLDDQNNFINKSSYFVYIQVKLVNISSSLNYFWCSKNENFTAFKPNMQQLINFDLSNEIKSHFMPDRIQIYLVYDVNNLIYDSIEYKIVENLNEFCVCLYDYAIGLQDLFEQEHSTLINSNLTPPNYTSSILFKLLSNRLKNYSTWNEIIIDNVKLAELNKNNIISNTQYLTNMSSNVMPNMNLNLSAVSNDLFNMSIYSSLKNNTISYSMLAQKLSNLIYIKNKFILSNLFSHNQIQNYLKKKISHDETYSLVQALMDEVNKIKEKKQSLNQNSDTDNNKMIADYSVDDDIIDDSIKMDDYSVDMVNSKSINDNNFNSKKINPDDFYSIDTLLNLFEIYLKTRSLQYTNIKL